MSDFSMNLREPPPLPAPTPGPDGAAAPIRMPLRCCSGPMSSSSESSAASTGSSGLSAEAEAAEGRRRAAWFQAVDEREAQKAREAAAREGPPSPADPPQATVEAPVAAFDFDEAAVFGGERAGFVFRTGPNGTGYYRDAPPRAAPPPSASALIRMPSTSTSSRSISPRAC